AYGPWPTFTLGKEISGADYDAVTQRLYLLIDKADSLQNRFESQPVLLVYSLRVSDPSGEGEMESALDDSLEHSVEDEIDIQEESATDTTYDAAMDEEPNAVAEENYESGSKPQTNDSAYGSEVDKKTEDPAAGADSGSDVVAEVAPEAESIQVNGDNMGPNTQLPDQAPSIERPTPNNGSDSAVDRASANAQLAQEETRTSRWLGRRNDTQSFWKIVWRLLLRS
ncbi:MAG: hypothetical protein AAGI88_21840, partial [Pseudomonadota bacterium]